MAKTDHRVVIIGGGLAGLTAAYDLGRTGARVTLLESAPTLGGLASSIHLEGVPVERFYHFICASDHHLMTLVDELGIEDKLHWTRTSTAFYFDGRSYDFGTPLDLLRFSAIPPLQRLRFGLHVTRSRYRDSWRELDKIPAKDWLIECIGERAYEVIWHPLLKVKFGDAHDRISAAWIWHRIWRVAKSRRRLWDHEQFGSLEVGTATIVDALVSSLKARPNVRIVLDAKVQPLEVAHDRVHEVRTGTERFPCDAVVSTVALPTLDRLVPGRTDPYFDNVRKVQYIGVVCLMLRLREAFSRNFWTNVNDPGVSFNGFIEQSNLNRHLRAKGLHVLYVPFYLPTDHPRYTAPDQTVFDEVVPMLARIRPGFRAEKVVEWHVFRAPYAQALFTTGFADQMPAHRSSVRNLYVTDSTQFYPEDRTLSAAIHQGRKVARMIRTDDP